LIGTGNRSEITLTEIRRKNSEANMATRERKKRAKRKVKKIVQALDDLDDNVFRAAERRLWDADNWDAEARKMSDESRPQLTNSIFFILK
jgi:hypothetical protein